MQGRLKSTQQKSNDGLSEGGGKIKSRNRWQRKFELLIRTCNPFGDGQYCDCELLFIWVFAQINQVRLTDVSVVENVA